MCGGEKENNSGDIIIMQDLSLSLYIEKTVKRI